MDKFCLKNMRDTWLQVQIGTGFMTIKPGEIAGPFTSEDLTDDLRRKIARGDFAGLEYVTVVVPTTVDKIEIDISPKIESSEENNVEPTQDGKTGRRARRQS